MYAAIHPKSSDCANGDAFGVSTDTIRILRDRISLSTVRSAGTSNTSCRHFARGLEQHRKRRVLRRDREQVGGALALLPQGGALTGPAAGQQQ